MNDAEFQSILDQLSAYLKANKKFIINPMRKADFEKAISIAMELFPDAEIKTEDDPLEMGSGILVITSFDVGARGEREINLWSELIKLADNFEIIHDKGDDVRFALLFQHVLVRI